MPRTTDFNTIPLYLASPLGVTPVEFREELLAPGKYCPRVIEQACLLILRLASRFRTTDTGLQLGVDSGAR